MYQTGTATDVLDLLDKLRAFALSAGWTVNTWTTPWLSLAHPDTLHHFNLRGDTGAGNSNDPGPRIEMKGATGYSGGSAWDAQPGTHADKADSNKLAGPFTAYHFFAQASPSDYLHVVIEVSAGVFKHFLIGLLEKYGTFTGGAYVQGSKWFYQGASNGANWPDGGRHQCPFDGGQQDTQVTGYRNYVRAVVDSKEWWHSLTSLTTGNARHLSTGRGPNTVPSGPTATQRSPCYPRDAFTPNEWNHITPLFPVKVWVERLDTLWSPVGQVRDFRTLRGALIAPGATITLGSDVWVCFPLHKKTDVFDDQTTNPSSGYYFIAYRKLT